MNHKKLSATVTASDQITASDLPEIAELGFRSIICNRPDGESADQAAFAEISAEARQVALHAHYLPIRSRPISNDDASAFADLFEQLPKPILIYCRTGARSVAVWQSAKQLSAVPQRKTDLHARHAPL